MHPQRPDPDSAPVERPNLSTDSDSTCTGSESSAANPRHGFDPQQALREDRAFPDSRADGSSHVGIPGGTGVIAGPDFLDEDDNELGRKAPDRTAPVLPDEELQGFTD